MPRSDLLFVFISIVVILAASAIGVYFIFFAGNSQSLSVSDVRFTHQTDLLEVSPSCDVSISDPSNKTLNLTLSWFLDGVKQEKLDKLVFVYKSGNYSIGAPPMLHLSPNQGWRCSVVADDGTHKASGTSEEWRSGA